MLSLSRGEGRTDPTQSQLPAPELSTGAEAPGESPIGKGGRSPGHRNTTQCHPAPGMIPRSAPGHFTGSPVKPERLRLHQKPLPPASPCGSLWLPGTHSANGLESGFQPRALKPLDSARTSEGHPAGQLSPPQCSNYKDLSFYFH